MRVLPFGVSAIDVTVLAAGAGLFGLDPLRAIRAE